MGEGRRREPASDLRGARPVRPRVRCPLPWTMRTAERTGPRTRSRNARGPSRFRRRGGRAVSSRSTTWNRPRASSRSVRERPVRWPRMVSPSSDISNTGRGVRRGRRSARDACCLGPRGLAPREDRAASRPHRVAKALRGVVGHAVGGDPLRSRRGGPCWGAGPVRTAAPTRCDHPGRGARGAGNDALNAREMAIFEVPIGVAEFGKIVRITNVLGRQIGLEASSQLDHLASLQFFHRGQKVQDFVDASAFHFGWRSRSSSLRRTRWCSPATFVAAAIHP